MSDLDLAYLAGIVDADGYVTATRSQHRSSPGRWYFGAQIGITGSDRAPHDLAARIFGGNVNAHQPGTGRAHHRIQFHWQRGGRRAVPVIEALLPYLRIKRTRALLVLELQAHVDHQREAGEDSYPWFGPDHDPAKELHSLVDDIRGLHTRQPVIV